MSTSALEEDVMETGMIEFSKLPFVSTYHCSEFYCKWMNFPLTITSQLKVMISDHYVDRNLCARNDLIDFDGAKMTLLFSHGNGMFPFKIALIKDSNHGTA